MAQDFDFSFRPGSLQDIEIEVEPLVKLAADRVAERAQKNARSISPALSDAIVADGPNVDEEGVYADVGYDRHAPGFVLWWHEVGTSRYGASPHLRPAASRKVI